MIQAAGVIFAAALGWRGITTWRRQLIGRRKAEVAEQALTASYRIREAFDFIRSPAAFGGEGETRERDGNESEGETRLRNTAFVPVERINKAGETFTELQKARLLCKVYFGDAAEQPFVKLLGVRSKVIVAARMLSMTAQDRAFGQFKDRKIVREWEAVIWDLGTDDQYKQAIAQAVAEIEAICAPHLKDRDPA